MHFALFYSYFGDKGEPIEKIPKVLGGRLWVSLLI